LGFLAKYNSLARVQLENAPEKITDQKSAAILDHFKMRIHQYFGILYWERKDEALKYPAGKKEYKELEKCQSVLIGAKRLVPI
jgi:hypothetical protein